MELDWTTFGLQVINFLALLWLLKRLLYQPVMGVIASRQQAIEHSVQQSRRTLAEAEAMQADLQRQLAGQAQQRTEALQRLDEEIGQERQHRLERLDEELRRERKRTDALAESRVQAAIAASREQAQRQAHEALSLLLQRLAGPALDERLLDMLIEDLPQLPPDQLAALRQAAQVPDPVLELTSARPLAAADKERLCKAMEPVTACAMRVVERVDPALTSGLRIGLGPWLLAASLADELSYFRAGAQRDGK